MVISKQSQTYLLAGTEEFLKQENLARLKSAYLKQGSADFNFNSFYAGSTSAKEVLECALTAPFLAEKRVVVVRGIEDFSKPDQEIIISYLNNPHRLTVFILETNQAEFNDNFLRKVSSLAEVVLCESLSQHQLSDWIDKQLKSWNKGIDAKAKKLLLENLDNNLELIENFLKSLSLYIGERQIIEITDVASLVGPDVTTTAFELFDAVCVGSKKKALRLLDSLLKDNVNAAQILGALIYKLLYDKQKLDPAVFSQALCALEEADRNVKTGRQDARIALELLVVKLLGLF